MDRYLKFPILKYFKYDHLPSHLQKISKPFSELAHNVVDSCIDNGLDTSETVVGVRKLLEAKDAIVRSNIK